MKIIFLQHLKLEEMKSSLSIGKPQPEAEEAREDDGCQHWRSKHWKRKSAIEK